MEALASIHLRPITPRRSVLMNRLFWTREAKKNWQGGVTAWLTRMSHSDFSQPQCEPSEMSAKHNVSQAGCQPSTM